MGRVYRAMADDKTAFQRLVNEEFAEDLAEDLRNLRGEMEGGREITMQFFEDDLPTMIEELEEMTDGE